MILVNCNNHIYKTMVMQSIGSVSIQGVSHHHLLSFQLISRFVLRLAVVPDDAVPLLQLMSPYPVAAYPVAASLFHTRKDTVRSKNLAWVSGKGGFSGLEPPKVVGQFRFLR